MKIKESIFGVLASSLFLVLFLVGCKEPTSEEENSTSTNSTAVIAGNTHSVESLPKISPMENLNEPMDIPDKFNKPNFLSQVAMETRMPDGQKSVFSASLFLGKRAVKEVTESEGHKMTKTKKEILTMSFKLGDDTHCLLVPELLDNENEIDTWKMDLYYSEKEIKYDAIPEAPDKSVTIKFDGISPVTIIDDELHGIILKSNSNY